MANFTIPPEKLGWKADTRSIEETSTRKAPQSGGIVGQAGAREALRFALTTTDRNHNVFVRGPAGSGRRSLVRSAIADLKPKPRRSLDFCYVHNFSNPDRPRLIVLPGGQGRQFQHAMTRISLFVRDRLPDILKNDPIRSRREARKEAAEREIRIKIKPLEKRLADDGLALMRTQSGPTSRVSIYPRVMGKAVSPEEYRNLVTQGQAREEDRLKSIKKAEEWQSEVNRFAHDVNQIWQQAIQHIDQIDATETARILGGMTAEVAKKFKAAGIDIFLREIIDDIVEKRIGRDTSHLADPTLLYGVNVLTSRSDQNAAPVVHASQPSVANLFGTIDPAWISSGRAVTSFRGIRTGALLEADGGYLVLDARDVLAEPNAWRLLMRALRTGLSEVVPPDLGWPYSAQSLKPEPIPVQVRVILIGDPETYDELARDDRDFVSLFKVLSDFDRSLPRDEEGFSDYVRFLGSLVKRDELPHFDQGGMLAMIEYGARRSPEQGRLSACLGELADLAREAAVIARDAESEDIGREHVQRALEYRHLRHAMPMTRLFRRFDAGNGWLRLRGKLDGQVPGVSCDLGLDGAPALPTLISATAIRADERDIRIDGRPEDGRIALALARMLRLDSDPKLLVRLDTLCDEHCRADLEDPGLDLARHAALLAALANAPLRQDVALVGSVDAMGEVQPVAALNERIEAWFEFCQHAGLSGQQAVLIPRPSQNDLMLSRELIKAAANDMFRVYAVSSAVQAAELCTGVRAGSFKDGAFPEESLLGRARAAVLG
ncbi:AAA family ATPase [Wenzhouxiangella marina]|uniref:Uncharacterized protein n=1 Tax=Wenzhouxiangella marina TaxID=1579979 RepID=A0A0K0XUT8_9GAMM|nr:ATP-binding protein [Wenzhouxiangella marina]AKS41474.1 hypothetical protein WM2015_1099 [Wenzhouxiangella marina]MBB6086769.1 ATP-dependent Lon protease [Wenzhouxiangella marina]